MHTRHSEQLSGDMYAEALDEWTLCCERTDVTRWGQQGTVQVLGQHHWVDVSALSASTLQGIGWPLILAVDLDSMDYRAIWGVHGGGCFWVEAILPDPLGSQHFI